MSLFKKLSGFFGEAPAAGGGWLPGANAEVAATWQNPDGIIPPPAWPAVAADLRARAAARKMRGSVNEQPAARPGFPTAVFAAAGSELTVTAFVEHFDGGSLKHVAIRMPGDQFLPGMPELFQQVALAFEPDEPAFQHGYRHKEGTYWHLVWPADWLEETWLSACEASLPMWRQALTMHRTGDRWDVVSAETFHGKAVAAGLERWKEALVKNLLSVTVALAFLDAQAARDLFWLQLSLSMRVSVGGVTASAFEEPFNSLVRGLMEHRLGPCQACGQVVCDRCFHGENRAIPEELRTSTVPCRQAKAMGIWPLNRAAYLGQFLYTCGKCGAESKYNAVLRATDPPPPPPAVTIRPYSELMKR